MNIILLCAIINDVWHNGLHILLLAITTLSDLTSKASAAPCSGTQLLPYRAAENTASEQSIYISIIVFKINDNTMHNTILYL